MLHAAVCALRVGIPAFLLSGDEKAERFVSDVCLTAEALSLPSPISLFTHEGVPLAPADFSALSSIRISEEMRKKMR